MILLGIRIELVFVLLFSSILNSKDPFFEFDYESLKRKNVELLNEKFFNELEKTEVFYYFNFSFITIPDERMVEGSLVLESDMPSNQKVKNIIFFESGFNSGYFWTL
tara:strand:- start:2801 stop:3121 length:321 start_codon:yes stop_codon:yes gene_type:complete